MDNIQFFWPQLLWLKAEIQDCQRTLFWPIIRICFGWVGLEYISSSINPSQNYFHFHFRSLICSDWTYCVSERYKIKNYFLVLKFLYLKTLEIKSNWELLDLETRLLLESLSNLDKQKAEGRADISLTVDIWNFWRNTPRIDLNTNRC